MINYIKSELYRIAHTKSIYLLTGGCAALLLAMNLVLYIFRVRYDDFPYASTNFAFSMVTNAFGFVLFLTLLLGPMVFSDEYKNRTWMNSIAFGCSRWTIFAGKVIAGMIVSALAIASVLAIFIGSAYLMLENSGREAIYMLLRGVLLNIPIFMAGEIGVYMFLALMPTRDAGMWSWIGLIMLFPSVCDLLGMKFKFFARLSPWLIYHAVGAGEMNDTGHYVMAFMTEGGMIKCLVSGIAGIVIFMAIGLVGISRKEFK